MSRRVLTHLGVFLAFLVIGCAFTWPVALRLSGGVWGRTWDVTNNLWFFDQMRYMLASGDLSLTTTRVFFPFGYDLRPDLAHFLLPLLSVPLQRSNTLPEVYNLLMLLSLAFSGWAAFLLARRFTQNQIAALLAGLFWLINPITVRELAAGRLEVACSGFFLLAFYALLWLAERPEIGRAVTLVAAWLLTGLTNWVMAGMFGLVVLAVSPFLVYRRGEGVNKRAVVLIAGALLLTAAIAWPMVGPLAKGESLSIDDTDVSLARIIPDAEVARQVGASAVDPFQALSGDSFDPADLFVAQDPSDPAAPLAWWLIWGLALLGLADAERRRGWLVALAAGFLVLSLGPYLRWYDHYHFTRHQLAVPLPAWLFYKLVPGFDLFYRPYRFLLPALLLLIGPAAVGLAWLLRLGKRAWAGRLLAAASVAAILLVGLVSYHGDGGAYTTVYIPNEYRTEIRELKPQAIIEVPFYPLPTSQVNAQAMLAQTTHLSSIFNATLLRLPGWQRVAAFAEENTMIGTLLDLQLKRPGPYRVKSRDARELVNLGFDTIIVHTSYLEDEPFADRYRRMPHELLLLLDRAYGSPQELEMGLVYRATDIRASGPVAVAPDAVARLRFARQYFRPPGFPEPAGYVSWQIGAEGRSEALAVSAPEQAAKAGQFWCWLRYHTRLRRPDALWLEAGYGPPGEGPVWRAPLPWVEKLEWGWRKIDLSEFHSADTDEPLAPERLGWLRLAQEGGDPLVVDMDDAAFITIPILNEISKE
ncbi:MAG: hypothetical protein ACTSXZ_04805 [Alphaproteobacteria bacterium]